MTPPAMVPVFVFSEDGDDVGVGLEVGFADAVEVGVDEDAEDDEVLCTALSRCTPFPCAQHCVALIWLVGLSGFVSPQQ